MRNGVESVTYRIEYEQPGRCAFVVRHGSASPGDAAGKREKSVNKEREMLKPRLETLCLSGNSIVLLATLLWVLAATGALAADVEFNGDVGINGAGKGIIFPDATTQTTAGEDRFVRTIVVRPTGTGATQDEIDVANGDLLKAAIFEFAFSRPHSMESPALIKLEPGTYDLNGAGITLPSYVNLEGSGRWRTTITSTVCSADTNNRVATVEGSATGGIRSVGIENTGSGGSSEECIAYLNKSGSALLKDAHVEGQGHGSNNVAIYSEGSWLELDDVLVTAQYGTASNVGVMNDGGGASIKNSGIGAFNTAGHGIENLGSVNSVYVDGSQVTASTKSVANTPGFNMYLSSTELGAGADTSSGTWKCVAVFDSTYTALGPDCQ